MMPLTTVLSLVEKVTDPCGPKLYRQLYTMAKSDPALRISSRDEWNALPFLDKETLLDTPLDERIFAGGADVDHFRVSSGTSGKLPLFSPRTYLRGMEYRTEYHDFKKPILAFGVPAMPHWHEHFQESLGHDPFAVVFDPKNHAASVRLAKIAGVDSISTFAFHIPILGPDIERERIGERIRFIELCGESCSRALFEYIRRVFPNATIVPFYGSSEVEDSPMGVPCRAITGEEPLALYHAKESQYHEIIDPESGTVIAPVSGAEGELVISAYPGEPSAFPLIRYRTGDMVRVIETRCAKHDSWSFTIIGRLASDFLKIPGGVLSADEVERVLRVLDVHVTDRFELHRYEEQTPSGPKIKIELHVDPRARGLDLGWFAQEFAKIFRVNPARTYARGVTDGLYLPLVCRILDKSPQGKKQKRIITH